MGFFFVCVCVCVCCFVFVFCFFRGGGCLNLFNRLLCYVNGLLLIKFAFVLKCFKTCS